MATINMAYDHPQYTVHQAIPTGQINGATGQSTKWSAWTSMIVKAIQLTASTTGTSADVFNIVKISGTATTTTAYGTVGSGGAGASAGGQNLVAGTQATLAQGDIFYVQKGADATGTYVGMVEVLVSPTANVTQ